MRPAFARSSSRSLAILLGLALAAPACDGDVDDDGALAPDGTREDASPGDLLDGDPGALPDGDPALPDGDPGALPDGGPGAPDASPGAPRFPGDPGAGRFYVGVGVNFSRSGSTWVQTDENEALLSSFAPARTRKLGYYRAFAGNDMSPPYGDMNQAIGRGELVHVSWKGDPASIAAGNQDASLASIADWFKQQSVPVWWTYYHEPEDNFTTRSQADAYRAAVRYQHAYFKDHGVTNAAHVATAYMNNWSFVPASHRDWRWWFPNWKGTSTDGATWENPNPADFYTRGGPDDVIELVGLDTYSGWKFGASLSSYNVEWFADSMADADDLLAAAGQRYPYAIPETGFRVKQSGSFTSSMTCGGHSGTPSGWSPSTYDEADSIAAVDSMLTAFATFDVVAVSYWNNSLCLTASGDQRLEMYDPNQIRWKGIARWMDSPGYAMPW